MKKTKTERLSLERFQELKDRIYSIQRKRKEPKGWKYKLCQEFNITFYSLYAIINGTQSKPPFTGSFKGIRQQIAYAAKTSIRCSFCNSYVLEKGKHTSGDSEYCSAVCKKLSQDYRKFQAKEPHPIMFGRSHRVIGVPKFNGIW